MKILFKIITWAPSGLSDRENVADHSRSARAKRTLFNFRQKVHAHKRTLLHERTSRVLKQTES